MGLTVSIPPRDLPVQHERLLTSSPLVGPIRQAGDPLPVIFPSIPQITRGGIVPTTVGLLSYTMPSWCRLSHTRQFGCFRSGATSCSGKSCHHWLYSGGPLRVPPRRAKARHFPETVRATLSNSTNERGRITPNTPRPQIGRPPAIGKEAVFSGHPGS